MEVGIVAPPVTGAVPAPAPTKFTMLETAILESYKVANSHLKSQTSHGKSLAKLAKEELVPKIEAMRGMLSKQGHRTDLGQPAGKTFVEWLDDNKAVLGSRATVYRLMKKGGGGEITPKKFKIGDRLQEKGSTPVCIVTNLHAVNDEDGTQGVDVRFELDGAERLDVPTSGFHKFKAPEIELNDLRTFEGAEYIVEAAEDGSPKLTRTATPTEDKAAKQKKKDDAAREKAERSAGALPPCGPNPGQVSDAKATENAKRHKPVVVTPKLVKAETQGEKKTTIVDTTIVNGKPGPTYGEVIARDVLKAAPKAKAKPGPKPKVKTVEPSPDSEPRKGFEVVSGLICDPDLYPDAPGHYGPNPDAAVEPPAPTETQ